MQRSNPDADFINQINELSLKAIEIMNSICHEASENNTFSKLLMEDSKRLSHLVKDTNDLVNLMILGYTNSGKSTLGCYLTKGYYFKSSNIAETYYPTQVLNVNNDSAPAFKIEKYFKKNEEIVCDSIIPENEEECYHVIESFKKDKKDDDVINLKIFVKNLSNESGLDESVIIQDTPGLSEAAYQEVTKEIFESYWGSSIALIVVDSGSGTLDLAGLQDILRIFKENDCTDRIIFVFTKVLNHIQCCKPNHLDSLKKSQGNRLETAINKANETLSFYQKQIKDNYPNASFVLFDQDEEQSGDYFYRKEILKYEYVKGGSNDESLINVGLSSIEYLRQLINELAKKSVASMKITKQKNKYYVVEESITRIYNKFSTFDEISKKIEKFKNEADIVFKEAKNTFEIEIKQKFDFESDLQGPGSPFYKFINETLKKIDKEDSKVRLSKNNYIKHLTLELGKKIQEYLQAKIAEIYELISKVGTEKLKKLLEELNESSNEIKDSPSVESKFEKTKDQLLFALGGAAGSAALVGCIGVATSQTLVWAFGVQMSASAAAALGVEGTSIAGSVLLGGLGGAATLGIGLAVGAAIGGLIFVSWKRDTVVNNLSDKIYKEFTTNEKLKENLINAGHKVLENRLIEIQTKALSFFKPTLDHVPGCPAYSELYHLKEQMNKKIQEYCF